MSETEFHQLADSIYLQIEDIIDDSGADLDYENSGGVMTITCEVDGSKVILSRQPAIGEIWLAARSGGFHFKRDGKMWICATKETLNEALSRVIEEQSAVCLEFNFY